MPGFKYETHCHTSETSGCAKATAKESVEYYKSANYDGVFITDHFLCGGDRYKDITWDERIDIALKGYLAAKKEGEKVGLKVFFGFEYTYAPCPGTDFLIYCITPEWLRSHPEIAEMPLKSTLELFKENGAFIIHAHPFREARYIDMIRLLPRHIDGTEIINANRTDDENEAAEAFAEHYSLIRVGGTDNHTGGMQPRFCGIESHIELNSPEDYAAVCKSGDYDIFDELNVRNGNEKV